MSGACTNGLVISYIDRR